MSLSLGINYGHVSAAYSDAQINADLNLLKSKGITKIRVAFPPYSTNGTYAIQKNIISLALAKGFYVIWGVCCLSDFTDVQWAAFKTEVQVVAAYAQSLNNANFELSIGNEEELKNNGASAPDDATVRSDLKTLATAVQAIYTVGSVSYQTSQSHIAAWNTIGRGNIDILGFNCYDSLANFSTNVALVFADFGANGCITEWNCNNGYTGAGSEQVLETETRNRLAILAASGISSAYFFTFNHTSGSFGITDAQWNVLLEDNVTFRDAFQAMTGKRKWYVNI